MWPHRPVGRGLMSAALALLALPTLWLDATAAAAGGADARLLAWHALSTSVLAGLAGLALWAPGWPAAPGRALAVGVTVPLALALALAPVPAAAPAQAPVLAALLLSAGLLLTLGMRWSAREIRW